MIYNDLFLEYIDLKGNLQTPYEVTNKVSRHENHISPVIGNMELKDIKYKDCQKVINNMIYLKELAPKTAKNVLAVMVTVLNYAIKNDYIEKNVAHFVDLPKFDNRYRLSLNDDQISSLINEILVFEPQYRAIFIFALHGRRKSEILSMQWYQIDFSSRVYHVPPQKNKSRKYDIHEMTQLLFNELYLIYLESKKIDLVKDKDYVFINPNTLTRYQDLKRPFNRLKNKAGIDKFRFHDFRHLLCSYTINSKKENIEHVSQALGHSSIEVTQK
jgi:integrase